MLNVAFAMLLLGAERGLQAGDETGKETRPDGGHVVFMLGQVYDDDGASGLVPFHHGICELADGRIEFAKGLGLNV